MNTCEHKTLHFEGKRIAWLVCSCGKRWERCVEYQQSRRYTFYRARTKLTPQILKDKYGIVPEEANMI